MTRRALLVAVTALALIGARHVQQQPNRPTMYGLKRAQIQRTTTARRPGRHLNVGTAHIPSLGKTPE